MTSNYSFTFDVFNNCKDMFLILNEEGSILQMNNSALNKLEPFLKKINSHNIFSLLNEEAKNKFKTAFSDFSDKSRCSSFTSQFILDEILDIEFSVSLIPTNNYSADDKLYLILARDITEQKQKELELLRFFSIAENTVNPLEITDVNGRIIYVNKAFVNSSGYSKEELIGQNPKLFGGGKNSKKFWEKMWNTISNGKVWVGEIENKRKNGEPYHSQVLISPIIDAGGKVSGYFGVHRDLSDKRVLEKQLIHTQKMESIGTLAAGIAHEVGNPLASISALVQVAQRSTTDPFISEKLGLVKSQVTRISKIIRDLVDFSRPSNYELLMTDINENIKEAVEITKVGTKAKNIDFEIDLTENIPSLPLIADQIQQVFVNILLNAVDAIQEKKDDTSRNKIVVKSFIEDESVIINFTDTGPGIPESNYTKVFEPFFTTKKQGKGTGLGLWVSYGIVKSFQGDIKIKSSLGSGTSFIINLPINP
ncbi:MAG TPA: PAS domain-containing protein [Ignavibacteriaceae bacterium]|nr:PAS domain-containing protein [Ignavibacteriaceae bacterium]